MKYKKIKIEDKIITIYNNDENGNKKPLLIFNSFKGDCIEIWSKCKEIGCKDFSLAVVENINWDDEMTPWETPPLFKNDEGCKGLANNYINLLVNEIIPEIEKIITPTYLCLVGYSFGGLFAIYTMYKTDIFSRIVSASGSFWYPEFVDFINKNNPIKTPEKIYLSLGDRERYSKNIESVVEENTFKIYEKYLNDKINIKFEFNKGGHFKEIYLRIAKGIKWILE